MKNALLVIDVQNIYKDGALACDNWKNVVENINELISQAKSNNDLIIYIKHIHKADGTDAGHMFDFTGDKEEIQFIDGTRDAEFIDELNVLKDSQIIIKNRYSSFVNTDLDSILKTAGVNKVTVCGFMTNFCCEMAARHAHDLDYLVDFVVSATDTPGTESLSAKEIIKATVANLETGCATII